MPGPLIASELAEAAAARPADAIMLAIDPDTNRSYMVMAAEPFLNEAGREIVHLVLFDYEAAEEAGGG